MTDDDKGKVAAGVDIELLTEDPAVVELCQRYWQMDVTGGFLHTVSKLAMAYGVSPRRVLRLVAGGCRAFSSAWACAQCGRSRSLRSRSDYSTRYVAGPGTCDECQEAMRLDVQRGAEDERRLRANNIHAELQQRRADFGWMPPRLLAFDDAVSLLSLYRAGGSDDLSFVLPRSEFALSLSPTTESDRSILDRLYHRGVIAIHPGSRHDAVVGDQGTFNSFYPFHVHWILPLPVDGPSSARYIEDLEGLLNSQEDWPADWFEDARELHRVVAFEECLQYWRLCLDEHGFDPRPGEKLSLVLRSVLKHFSIGQTYNFIWRAARDAAAFYVRARTSKVHAANIIPGALQRMAERAVAERWAVKAYRRDRRISESQVSHVLFTMALRLPDGGFNAVPPLPAESEPAEGDDPISGDP